jgi:hypothetical protein
MAADARDPEIKKQLAELARQWRLLARFAREIESHRL